MRADTGGGGPAKTAVKPAAKPAAKPVAKKPVAARPSSGGSARPSTGGTAPAAATSGATSGAVYDQSAAGKAASFGWSLAVINSDPELKALFAKATSTGAGGGWTTDHFVAAVRDTRWFKSTTDTARQNQILRTADPATYSARLSQTAAQVRTAMGDTGAGLTPEQFGKISTDSLMFGWNGDQLKQHLAAYVKAGADGNYGGGSATTQYQYTQIANQYGVAVAPATMGEWVRNTVMGTVNTERVKNWMIDQASSRYPSLAERLRSGETVQQIADPYIQSQAKILELNPNTINLTDKSIQSALASTDPKTGQPTTQPVWDYEQTLRNDPRYMKTAQAQDASMNMAHTVLQDWGVAS